MHITHRDHHLVELVGCVANLQGQTALAASGNSSLRGFELHCELVCIDSGLVTGLLLDEVGHLGHLFISSINTGISAVYHDYIDVFAKSYSGILVRRKSKLLAANRKYIAHGVSGFEVDRLIGVSSRSIVRYFNQSIIPICTGGAPIDNRTVDLHVGAFYLGLKRQCAAGVCDLKGITKSILCQLFKGGSQLCSRSLAFGSG